MHYETNDVGNPTQALIMSGNEKGAARENRAPLEGTPATDNSTGVDLLQVDGARSDGRKWNFEEADAEAEAAREPIRTYEPSEDAVARAFTDRFYKTFRYDPRRGWYVFIDGRWRAGQSHTLFEHVRQMCRYLAEDKKALLKAAAVRGVEFLVRNAHHIAPETWDRDPWMLGTPSGVVDLRTGAERTASPSDFISKSTTVSPERGDPVQWLAFLDQICLRDKDMVAYLQRIAGYCLTGVTTEQALFFMFGPGGNGKGVFKNILASILGDYAKAAPMETFTAKKFDQHPTELAMLDGARLVTASETEKGRKWAEARVNLLTGGDPVTARYMHRDFFTYTPKFKLIFLGNHTPDFEDVTDAVERRFNLLPFDYKPAVKDTSLEERLREEAPLILQWAIEGCLAWQREGLMRPMKVTATTQAYLRRQDPLAAFVAAHCELRGSISSRDLFESWRRYAERVGKDCGSQNCLTQSLQKRFAVKRKSGTNNVRLLSGIMLKSEACAA